MAGSQLFEPQSDSDKRVCRAPKSVASRCAGMLSVVSIFSLSVFLVACQIVATIISRPTIMLHSKHLASRNSQLGNFRLRTSLRSCCRVTRKSKSMDTRRKFAILWFIAEYEKYMQWQMKRRGDAYNVIA